MNVSTNYRIFRKFYLMASTKSGLKWLLNVSLKIFIMSKNGVNDAFRGREINIFEVFIKSVLYIVLKLHQMTGIIFFKVFQLHSSFFFSIIFWNTITFQYSFHLPRVTVKRGLISEYNKLCMYMSCFISWPTT